MAGGIAQQSRNLFLTTGIAGIAAVLGLAGGQGLILVGGGEPRFDAPAVAVQRFFESRNTGLFATGSYLTVISLVIFLWFVAGVSALLREAGEEGPWRANLALASGAVLVATGILGAWELAAFRVHEGLDPRVARLVFDMGNLWFANSWVVLGSFSLASGWAMVSARLAPRWLGWLAIVAGVGLVAARGMWTTPFWLFPYGLFWIWVVVLSVRLIRRRPRPYDAQVSATA
jgi:uncharacterized membrane protein